MERVGSTVMLATNLIYTSCNKHCKLYQGHKKAWRNVHCPQKSGWLWLFFFQLLHLILWSHLMWRQECLICLNANMPTNSGNEITELYTAPGELAQECWLGATPIENAGLTQFQMHVKAPRFGMHILTTTVCLLCTNSTIILEVPVP